MKNPQWYEVLRKDGHKQYALKYEDHPDYYLGGSGFGIREFDAVSVTPIDKIPLYYRHGFTAFDGTFCACKAYANINRSWNGWAMPWIHKDYIKYLMTDGLDQTKLRLDGDKLYWSYEDEPEELIKTKEIDGETYYWFGDMGWTFDFFPAGEYVITPLSPDDIPISMEAPFKTIDEAEKAVQNFIKRYEIQGYYSKANHTRIQLEDLREAITYEIMHIDYLEEE